MKKFLVILISFIACICFGQEKSDSLVKASDYIIAGKMIKSFVRKPCKYCMDMVGATQLCSVTNCSSLKGHSLVKSNKDTLYIVCDWQLDTNKLKEMKFTTGNTYIFYLQMHKNVSEPSLTSFNQRPELSIKKIERSLTIKPSYTTTDSGKVIINGYSTGRIGMKLEYGPYNEELARHGRNSKRKFKKGQIGKWTYYNLSAEIISTVFYKRNGKIKKPMQKGHGIFRSHAFHSGYN